MNATKIIISGWVRSAFTRRVHFRLGPEPLCSGADVYQVLTAIAYYTVSRPESGADEHQELLSS